MTRISHDEALKKMKALVDSLPTQDKVGIVTYSDSRSTLRKKPKPKK